MTTSQLIDAIKKWTAANGCGPTFNDLHQVLGVGDDELMDEIEKAGRANMSGQDDSGRGFVI